MQAVFACYTEKRRLRARDSENGSGAGRRGMEPVYSRKNVILFIFLCSSVHILPKI
jgi:hypothetical protein